MVGFSNSCDLHRILKPNLTLSLTVVQSYDSKNCSNPLVYIPTWKVIFGKCEDFVHIGLNLSKLVQTIQIFQTCLEQNIFPCFRGWIFSTWKVISPKMWGRVKSEISKPNWTATKRLARREQEKSWKGTIHILRSHF